MKTLIVIVSVIALSAVFGAVIVGEKVFDGVVVEKPYEQGLLWDRIQENKSELGWNAVIVNKKFLSGDEEVGVSAFDKNGKPLSGATVFLSISRPSTSVHDKKYEAAESREGLYTAAVNFPLYGYWDVKIDVARKDNSSAFEGRIFAEKNSPRQSDDPGMQHNRSSETRTDCDINAGACAKTIEQDTHAAFDINPKPVKPMSGLLFSLTINEGGKTVTDALVSLNLTMPGMFMGVNRPVLEHVGDGRYEGRGIIPICPHGGTLWKAEVTVKRGSKEAAVSYLFEVR